MTTTLFSLLVLLGGDWTVVKAVNGIITKARESATRDLPELEVSGEIAAGFHEVLAVMLEYPRQTRWMPRVDKLQVMKRFSPNEVRVYARLDAPWPVNDREVVVRNTVVVVDPGKHVEIRQQDERIPAPAKLQDDDNVRMPKMVARFTVERVTDARTRVTYRVDIDPGGALPDWLKRIIVERMPYRTIELLREVVAKTRGRHGRFIEAWKARHLPR